MTDHWAAYDHKNAVNGALFNKNGTRIQPGAMTLQPGYGMPMRQSDRTTNEIHSAVNGAMFNRKETRIVT